MHTFTPIFPSLLQPALPDDICRTERHRWWYWSLALAVHAGALAIGQPEPQVSLPQPLRARLHAPEPPSPPLPAAPDQKVTASRPPPLMPSRSVAPAPAVVVAMADAAPEVTATPTANPQTTASPSEAIPVIAAHFDADYLNNPKPDYPALSRRLQEEGKVLVAVLVSPQGHAAEVRLRQSSGYSRLDQAALEAVARWRFVPARRGEQVIVSLVTVPVAFVLE